MVPVHLPTVVAARELIADLVDNPMSLSEVEGHAPDPGLNPIYATYLTRSDEFAAVCSTSISLAAVLGSALALIPDTVARECAASGELTENLKDAFDHVVNICASLLCSESTPHVRLGRTYPSLDEMPEEAQALLADAGPALHMTIKIEDFGELGSMSFVTRKIRTSPSTSPAQVG